MRQSGHTRRTKRWAKTPINELEIMKGSIPISPKRAIAPGASLVCKVVNTK